ncbi:hypothetical protein ABIB27_003797 [Arthrobacter sp. UYEF21]
MRTRHRVSSFSWGPGSTLEGQREMLLRPDQTRGDDGRELLIGAPHLHWR